LENKLVKTQIGFCPGMETGVNIQWVMEELNKYKRNKDEKELFLGFIDLKGAYDWVNRNSLYKDLREKKVLEENEVQMLWCLQGWVKVGIGKNETTMKWGLIQGSLVSQAEWGIYFESILKKLGKIKNVKIFAFADDLLIITKCKEDLALAFW